MCAPPGALASGASARPQCGRHRRMPTSSVNAHAVESVPDRPAAVGAGESTAPAAAAPPAGRVDGHDRTYP
ncbi:hypothetical protein RHRU231_120024 [Rhodococcus ruber]|uniref:Uncharacterized protein n=1 Tax=Rhodococcus ruber TaxID=1830 RepID=A0A098BDV8_9NOCA|nr:hypothetical protein RHRU231_120024 [Rhodococcus ruber]